MSKNQAAPYSHPYGAVSACLAPQERGTSSRADLLGKLFQTLCQSHTSLNQMPQPASMLLLKNFPQV